MQTSSPRVWCSILAKGPLFWDWQTPARIRLERTERIRECDVRNGEPPEKDNSTRKFEECIERTPTVVDNRISGKTLDLQSSQHQRGVLRTKSYAVTDRMFDNGPASGIGDIVEVAGG